MSQNTVLGRFDHARIEYEAFWSAPDRLDVILRLAQLALTADDVAAARHQTLPVLGSSRDP
jgi:hypothetical protein